MAVSLPTAADVRKAREQAAKNAAARAEVARTPLLAVLGATDYAVATVSNAVAEARARAAETRTRATAQAEDVQNRVTHLPQRLNTDELRKLVADLRVQAEKSYAEFAERGEQAWGRIRKQPQVKNAIARIETYTEKLDARVDSAVDDAHDAAEKALGTVSRQTRSTGEQVARSTQNAAAGAADTVAEAGEKLAENIDEAGAEVAHEARSTTRAAANRTAPKVAPKSAVRKPVPHRTTTDGTKSGS